MYSCKEEGYQGGRIVNVGYPGWQLIVPHKSVATDHLSVGGGPVDERIRAGEGELILYICETRQL